MSQLSLFSADLTPPRCDDLGGVLAAHGQIVRIGSAARLSVLLIDHWRARALHREFRVRDIPADIVDAGDGVQELRSEATTELAELARGWTRGAVKTVPDGLLPDAGLLRCWALTAGRPDPAGYLLGLDPRAGHCHEPLAAALARSGIAGVLLGARGGGPAIRVVGHRRYTRLAELVGTPPPEAPAGTFPRRGS